MSRGARFRQADLERAIRAAQKAGLPIVGVRADGMVVVKNDGDKPQKGELPPGIVPDQDEAEALLRNWMAAHAQD